MALDVAVLIRAASGGLFVLVGVAVLAVSRRKAGPLALAAMLLSLGSALAINNLQRDASTTIAILPFLFIIAGVSALAVSVLLPRRVTRREWPAIALGLAVAVAMLACEGVGTGNGFPGVLAAFDGANGTLVLTFLGLFTWLSALVVTVSVRVAMTPPSDRAGWVRAFTVVAPIGLYSLFSIPTLFRGPTSLGTLAATLLLVGSVSITWLVAAARSRERLPVTVALTAAALGLLGYAYLLFPANRAAVFFDAYGALGILRIVGWALLVYGILRADLLGVPLPRVVVSRGTLAAGALALLFIVAQIAQNFFSAEFGLLTGGIVAGAFLFMASPLQRAVESLREREPRGDNAREGPLGGSPAEDAYKAAVRLALRGGITRTEELELARIADSHAIRAVRAHELRAEAEHEKGAP